MKNVTLTLTLDEANIILEGLGHLPFNKVFKVIEKVHLQASEQLSGNAAMPFVTKNKEGQNGDGH
jgi:hypothetical protein